MPNKPNSNNKLSMKTRLILIAIMFVIINLVFYVGFDSSEKSEIEIDNRIDLPTELHDDFQIEISDSTSP